MPEGPKLEIFVNEFFYTIQACMDLGTREKMAFFIFGALYFIFYPRNIFLAMSATALKFFLCLATSEKKLF
jgi:hypothetical protein